MRLNLTPLHKIRPKAMLPLLLSGAFFCVLTGDLNAKVFEDQGATFEVKEESLLHMIQRRLLALMKDGKWETLQAEIKEQAKKRVMRPVPVPGITKTLEERRFYFDPSITVEEDLKDHKGRLIHAKGTKVNPLDFVTWGEPLLLIDGDDATQVQWALDQKGKITCISGSPIELMETHQRRFYFDQGGTIVKKFGIAQVPARVTQDGKLLLIEELKGKRS